jgi:hypothetical protein
MLDIAETFDPLLYTRQLRYVSRKSESRDDHIINEICPPIGLTLKTTPLVRNYRVNAPQAQLAHIRGRNRGNDTIWPENLLQHDSYRGPRRTKARSAGRTFRYISTASSSFLPRELGMPTYFLSFSTHANLPLSLLSRLTHLREVVCRSNCFCRTMRHHARYR